MGIFFCKDSYYEEIDYIHIGPHRTGATFLQYNIFPSYYKKRKIFSDDAICGRLFDNGMSHVEKIYNLFPKAKNNIEPQNFLLHTCDPTPVTSTSTEGCSQSLTVIIHVVVGS